MLESIPGVQHAFSTRSDESAREAPGTFDLGAGVDTEPVFAERRLRLCKAVGLGGRAPVVLRQVHGSRLLDLTGRTGATAVIGAPGEPPAADGAIALRDESPLTIPAVRTADCVALLLADCEGRAVAAVHAGWRGAAAGIVGCAVDRLRERGVASRLLRAALGPAVGPCCYAVGPEVVEAVSRASGATPERLIRREDDRTILDLAGALRLQLLGMGLADGAISIAPWCTSCRGDLFFSYRRDGPRAGRMMAVIGWPGLTHADR
jgi:YfiH family protein